MIDDPDSPQNIVSGSAPTKKIKSSSYSKFPWIERTSEGYKCSLCCKFGNSKTGPWITELVQLTASKKLSEKAFKHSQSHSHLMAVAASSSRPDHMDVKTMATVHANKQVEKESNSTKHLLKLAYYLFSSEIPHTTSNWPNLIATAAFVDESGNLERRIKCNPQNAHRLSATTITEFLESFGDAVTDSIHERLRGISQYAVMADECTDINGREILSICVRHIVTEDSSPRVEETFLSAVTLDCTKADHITEIIVSELKKANLNPSCISAVSFDGAANFSGNISGVQTRLKTYSPNLLFVHCRSHLLQLALIHSCRQSPDIKRVISALNKLYTTFRGSHKRLSVLHMAEQAIDNKSHKLVQPGETRWLSYEGSVNVVVKHHAAICVALESIYVEAGDLSSDAGGLLLLFRKKSTVFILVLLAELLTPLARLSKALQSSKGNLTEATFLIKSVEEHIKGIDFDEINVKAEECYKKAEEQNVKMEDSDTMKKELLKLANNYQNKIVQNLKQRFSDQFLELAKFYTVFKEKTENPDFSKIAKLCGTSENDLKTEYKIYKRYPGNIETQSSMLMLACGAERKAMFPTLSSVATVLLLLPIGTACVERTFSTMNRILTSERSRLLPTHVDALMKICIEGPKIPDIRTGKEEEKNEYRKCIDAAYTKWLQNGSRRNI